MKAIGEAIEEYLGYLAAVRRFSPHTLQAYRTDLLALQDHLQQSGINHINDTDTRLVKGWVYALHGSGLKPASINRKLSAAKGFFKHARAQQWVSGHPMQDVAALKAGRKLPTWASEEQALTMVREELFDGANGMLNRVMVELLYGTGIRLSELMTLRTRDADLAQQQIKVLGKRNKQRIVPLHKELVALLREYTATRPPEAPLLHFDDGRSVYKMYIYRTINRVMGLAGVAGRRSPHIMRHTFATHMLNRGADINSIKELLGHSSLAATQVYTHNTIERLKKVYRQAHPRG